MPFGIRLSIFFIEGANKSRNGERKDSVCSKALIFIPLLISPVRWKIVVLFLMKTKKFDIISRYFNVPLVFVEK